MKHAGANRWCDGDEGDWCDPRGERVALCRVCGQSGFVRDGLCFVCAPLEQDVAA